MRPIVSRYTDGGKILSTGVKFGVSSPVCMSVPESRAGALHPQLFYWDNALVETRSLAPKFTQIGYKLGPIEEPILLTLLL